MVENKKLIVTLAPHVQGQYSVKKMMWSVILALLPALAVSIAVFGFRALEIVLYSVICCILCEYIIQRFLLKVKSSIHDGSAVITGILLAYNVPSSIPLWMILVGAIVAIGIGKMSFGGLGNNPFNPALVGRVFLLISFPVAMTSWPKPFAYRFAIDGITAATPLGILKEGMKNQVPVSAIMNKVPSYVDLFIGRVGGCIGEISALALLIGFVYLIFKKVITWHIPVAVSGGIFFFSGILWLMDPRNFADPLFQILTGGVMLGAIFMATDYVTSPMTPKGMLIFGLGIALLTVLIRTFGTYPEGVSFAILIMNAFVPLIDQHCPPQRFGE